MSAACVSGRVTAEVVDKWPRRRNVWWKSNNQYSAADISPFVQKGMIFLCFSSDNWSKEQVYPKFSWAINYDLTAGFVEGWGRGCVAFGVGQKTEKKYLKLGHIIMCSLCVWGGRHRKWSTVQDSFLQITSHTLQRAHFSKKWTSKGHGCAPTCVTFWCFFWCHSLVWLSGLTIWCQCLVSLSSDINCIDTV